MGDAQATKVLPGDYAAARARVLRALGAVPGVAVAPGAAHDGVIRATRKRLLGRVDLTVRLVEIETGDVEVSLAATSSGLADAAATLREAARALGP